MEKELIKDYLNGSSIYDICDKYHIGKLKVKKILTDNGVEIRKRGAQKQEHNYKVDNWNIEKYPNEEGYYYEAHSKDGKFTTRDYMNGGGFLTSYIKKEYGVEVPSLYDRREYYKISGDYWWEQWFDIVKVKKQESKKCPYCDWETIDLDNRSGAFETHLREVHGKTVEEYLLEYPMDKEYFKRYLREKNRVDFLSDERNYVVCPICGKKFPKITYSHVHLKHGISMREFKKLYPDVKIMSEEAIDQIKREQLTANLHVSKNRFVSKYEKEIQEWLTSKGVEFECNRQILFGKEIDLLIPSLRIGIEFDGLKWHTETFGKKDKNYHLNKTIKCNENGYKLIHIFEDEYVNKKDIVFGKLSHLLHLNNNLPKIQGRCVVVREIYKNDAMIFLEKWHIQGFSSSSVYFGAFYNEELVGVMSFKKGNVKNPNWELTRFATDGRYKYQGVASKIFSHFIKVYDPSIVVSFADRRWTLDSEENLYTKLNFNLESANKPDYRYYNATVDRYKRVHKMTFNKQALHRKYGFPLTMTEKEMTKELGYDRIWDCGLFKYVWTKH